MLFWLKQRKTNLFRPFTLWRGLCDTSVWSSCSQREKNSCDGWQSYKSFKKLAPKKNIISTGQILNFKWIKHYGLNIESHLLQPFSAQTVFLDLFNYWTVATIVEAASVVIIDDHSFQFSIFWSAVLSLRGVFESRRPLCCSITGLCGWSRNFMKSRE